MSIEVLNVVPREAPLPDDVQAFVDEAYSRIAQFQKSHSMPGFVPSDYRRVYEVIRAVEETGIAPGNTFCEWGSGFGVIADLAAMLGFKACGIELERELIREARKLAGDFGLDVEFIQNTFIPGSGSPTLSMLGEMEWIETGAPHQETELQPEDYDVIFAYPWPGDERLFQELFESLASDGAILVMYRGLEDIQVIRKTGARE